MLRIPPADRADSIATSEIPRQEEKVREDHWGEATGRVPRNDTEFVETHEETRPPWMTPEEIKERNIAFMTAAVLWFLLTCGAAIVAVFVLKLIGHLIGV